MTTTSRALLRTSSGDSPLSSGRIPGDVDLVDPKSLSNEEALKQAGIDHILMHGRARDECGQGRTRGSPMAEIVDSAIGDTEKKNSASLLSREAILSYTDEVKCDRNDINYS